MKKKGKWIKLKKKNLKSTQSLRDKRNGNAARWGWNPMSGSSKIPMCRSSLCLWLFYKFITIVLSVQYSTNAKIPETDIWVQTEDQKSNSSKPLEKSYIFQGWATAE